MDEFKEIKLKNISWPDPVRDEINQKNILDMAKSILASGQIHPIVVEEKAGKYNGIVGRLRYEGARKAGKNSIMCRVHSFMEDSDRKSWQLIENLVRRDLNPVVRGEAYKKLFGYFEEEVGGRHDEKIVDRIRKNIEDGSGDKAPSKRSVWLYMQIAKDFPENVKAVLKTAARGTFGRRHAEQLLRLKEDSPGMLKMAEFIRDKQPTSVQLKAHINDYLKTKEHAIPEVKKAVEDREIPLRTAAIISEATEELQEPVLEMVKRGNLRSGDTKKVVDFTVAHEERVSELLSKAEEDPELGLAVAQGRAVLKTRAEKEIFFRGRRGLAEKETYDVPCKCPKCGFSFKKPVEVDWKKGEVAFN